MKIYGQNKVIQDLVNVIEVQLADIFNDDMNIEDLKEAIKKYIPSPIILKPKKKGENGEDAA